MRLTVVNSVSYSHRGRKRKLHPGLTLTPSHYVTLGVGIHAHSPASSCLEPSPLFFHDHQTWWVRINGESPKPGTAMGTAQPSILNLPLCAVFPMGCRTSVPKSIDKWTQPTADQDHKWICSRQLWKVWAGFQNTLSCNKCRPFLECLF